MKISVIIPSYQPQAYLWKCLDSIAAQTFDKKEFEVVLVLNGCDEPYRSNTEKYLSSECKGLNVKLMQTDESGASNARNIGLDNASGDFIVFVDDDDWLSPDYLQATYDIAVTGRMPLTNVNAVDDSTGETVKDYIQDVYNRRHDETVNSLVQVRSYFSVLWAKMIDRDTIYGRRFDKRFRNRQDSLFMLLISDKVKGVAFTQPSATYFRRVRHNSLSRGKKTFRYLTVNNMRLMRECFAIYLSAPARYYLPLAFTRVMAATKNILRDARRAINGQL